MDILEAGMRSFVTLKQEVYKQKDVAKNYANSVINTEIQNHIYSPVDYDALINQSYDNDAIIKDIIKRERKLKNDN